jgi:Glutaredoxin
MTSAAHGMRRSMVAQMAINLHRCSTTWKFGPCWRVQKALDEQRIDYKVVKGPSRPAKRVDLQRLSGQRLYPVIEFENGSTYRDESKKMAMTIRAGKLGEKRAWPASWSARSGVSAQLDRSRHS